MTDQQHPDDSDITQRHEVPAEPPAWPASAGTTATPVTPATGDSDSPAVERYSPPAEPRTDWSRHEGGIEPATTPERWYEPAVVPGTVPTTPVQPATSGSGRSGRGGIGTLLAAALLSAVLASGGTVLALRASGVLDRPTLVQAGPTGTTVGANNQPITIESLGHHQCRRQGQPGGRPDHDRRRCRHVDRHHPRDRRRVGRHLRRRRLDPHEPPRRRGQRHPVGRAQRRPRPRWHRLRHRHPDRPRDRQGRGHRSADGLARRLERAQGRPARHRHRQPARHVLELGHQRHRVGQGPDHHGRRQRRTSTTSSRPTRRSTPATPVDRCSTRAATWSASTPPSRPTPMASALRSRSTSPGRSWSRRSPARSSPVRTWASSTARSTSSSRTRTTCRSTRARSSSPVTAPTRRPRPSSPAARPSPRASAKATSSSRSTPSRSTATIRWTRR